MGPNNEQPGGDDQDKRLNPGEEYGAHLGNVGQGREKANTGEESAAGALSAGERSAATGANKNTNVGQSERNGGMASAAASMAGGAGGIAGIAGRAFKFIMGHKKSSTGVALITVIIILLAFNVASPLAILVAIKEVLSKFPMRETDTGMSRRIAKNAKSRYMGVPECQGGRWKCRHQKGMSPKDKAKFEKAGFILDEKDKVTRGGKTFYSKISFMDADGKKITMDANNFEQTLRDHPNARAQFKKVWSSRSFITRSVASLKRLKALGIDRKRPVGGDEDTKESRIKKFRKYAYEKLSFAKLKSAEVDEKDEEGKDRPRAGDANESFDKMTQDVDRVNENAQSGNQKPEDIASARGLGGPESDLAKTGEGAKKGFKGGLKGALSGVLTSVDRYCALYHLVRVVSLTAKVLVAAQLIKYAWIFLTVADELKAGDGGAGGAAQFVADILLRPSEDPESIGKTFSDSPGWVAVTQGGIIDRESMMRFVTGGAIMLFFNRIKKMMETNGVTPDLCKHVTSWYGQAGIIIGGLITSFLTAGGGVVLGAALGFIQGAIEGLAFSYALPYITQAAAGTVAPDPEKDKEGGYGAGNAIGSGVAIANSTMAQSNGMRPLTNEAQAYIRKVSLKEQQTDIAAEQILNRERGVFSPTNSGSFQNKFALAMLPYASAITGAKNVATSLLSGGKLIQSALATIPNMFSRTAGAVEGIDPSSLNFYRGDACPDEDIQDMHLVATFSCAEVRGPSKLVMSDSDADGQAAVIQWLDDHKFLNADTGELSDEMKKFQDGCIESATNPLTKDGYNIDGTENTSEQCVSQDKKYDYFWTYFTDESINSSIDKAVDDDLGLEGASEQTDSGGKQYNTF